MDPLAVILKKQADSFFARGAAGAGNATGEHDAGSATLDVPLPGTAGGLVKVVDVDHDVGTRCGEESKVLEVGIAAELDFNARPLVRTQIGSHDFHGSTKKSKGRL